MNMLFLKNPTPVTLHLIDRLCAWYETQAAGFEEGRYTAIHNGVDVAQQLAKDYRRHAQEGRDFLAKNNSDQGPRPRSGAFRTKGP